jgi:phage shock protein E
MKRILFLSLALVLIACQAQAPNEGTYTNVSPKELAAMLADKDFVLINVHPTEGDIAGTDLSIPFDQITEPANLAQLPSDKDAKIVVYCRSGRSSEIAANSLVALGYTDIWNLEGGMIEWVRQGYELIANW